MKREFFYLSADGETSIHALEWLPAGEVRGILQISHGMVEYIDRYDAFASWLAGRGWYVTGNDHLGHGKSVLAEERYGYFGEPDGNAWVIRDLHRLRELTEEKYPGIPYFIMGHSMGSFLVRQYIRSYGKGLSGAVIMGTGYKGRLILEAGQLLCRCIARVKGWGYRSALVDSLGLGGYSRKFPAAEGKRAWVTSDVRMRETYEEDALCSFRFTVNGYFQMFEGMKTLAGKKGPDGIPGELPVRFTAGADDPVGDFGKAVEKVWKSFCRAGIKDCTIRLYPKDRHEILNERDRQDVYEDLFCWLEEHR